MTRGHKTRKDGSPAYRSVRTPKPPPAPESVAELEELTDSLPPELRAYRDQGLLSPQRRYYLEQVLGQRTRTLATILERSPESRKLLERDDLDPALRHEFWDHFHALSGDGRTILLTTHYLNEAEWCDRVGLMQRGRLIAEGTPDDLKGQAAAQSGQEKPDMEEVFLILTRESVAGGVG